jgi:hypothetical protein
VVKIFVGQKTHNIIFIIHFYIKNEIRKKKGNVKGNLGKARNIIFIIYFYTGKMKLEK